MILNLSQSTVCVAEEQRQEGAVAGKSGKANVKAEATDLSEMKVSAVAVAVAAALALSAGLALALALAPFAVAVVLALAVVAGLRV
jgi:hypothetical protein